jgi:hypothetical protein
MHITRRNFVKMGMKIGILAGASNFFYLGNGVSKNLLGSYDSDKDMHGLEGGTMINPSTIGADFKNTLAMQYSPIGFYYADKKPKGAVGFKKAGSGCIMPLILKSAKGATVAFDEHSTGWDCSAFFLGYKDWIYTGVEYFLSHGPVIGMGGERFVKTPRLAKQYLKSLRPTEKAHGTAVFKPLEKFGDLERPEIVIFFANPDQLSALVYLLYFSAPLEENRVVARFASGCASVVTLPLRYARNGMHKAVWGLHDISARARLPAELMTLTFPFNLLVDMWKDVKKSFLTTDNWETIAQRIANNKTHKKKD